MKMKISEETLNKAVMKGILLALEEGKLKFKDVTLEQREAFKNRLLSNPKLVEKILADQREFKNLVGVIRSVLQ